MTNLAFDLLQHLRESSVRTRLGIECLKENILLSETDSELSPILNNFDNENVSPMKLNLYEHKAEYEISLATVKNMEGAFALLKAEIWLFLNPLSNQRIKNLRFSMETHLDTVDITIYFDLKQRITAVTGDFNKYYFELDSKKWQIA